MKTHKRFLLAAALLHAGLSGYAADLVVSADTTTTTSVPYDNINFVADGVTLTAGSHTYVNGNITVGSGVNATFTSNSGAAYYLAYSSAVTSSTIGGSGSSLSKLLFNGYICGLESGSSTKTMYISDITLEMQRNASYSNNLLRAGNIIATNAVIGVKASTASSQITSTSGITLNNSTLRVDSGATLSYSGLAALNGGTLDINGTMSSSLSSLTIAGTSNYIKGTSNLTFGGTTSLSGTSSLYITSTGKVTSTVEVDVVGTGASLTIGADALGNTYASNFVGNIQGNAGTVVVNGITTLNSSAARKFFVASANASSSGESYVGSGVTIYATQSRFNKGTFNGLIDTTGVMTSNGWNYSLAFGAYSTTGINQRANTVTLGTGAQTNVNPTASTYFGIYGDVTSNAASAALKSNANAPLMIYNTSVLTLNSTDAFAVGGAASQGASTFNLYAGAAATIAVNEDNNIGTVNFGDGSARLTLNIAEDKLLTVGSFSNSVVGGLMAIALCDALQYGEFKITNMSDVLANYAAQSTLVFTDSTGASSRILGTNLFITETNTGSGEYYIYSVAVPEPAEWAAIFGAIVLGLAIYRRKNK